MSKKNQNNVSSQSPPNKPVAMGRPPLPKDQKRTRKIMLRLTDEEFDAITECIHNQTVAEGIRDMVLRSAQRKADIASGKKIERPPRLTREQFDEITDRY
jgi:hypothetical protein